MFFVIIMHVAMFGQSARQNLVQFEIRTPYQRGHNTCFNSAAMLLFQVCLCVYSSLITCPPQRVCAQRRFCPTLPPPRGAFVTQSTLFLTLNDKSPRSHNTRRAYFNYAGLTVTLPSWGALLFPKNTAHQHCTLQENTSLHLQVRPTALPHPRS